MTSLTKQHLAELIQRHERYCVSLYFTAHAPGEDHRKAYIRFKDLVGKARAWLGDLGVERAKVDAMLAEVNGQLENQTLWLCQGDGIAVFIDSERTRMYRMPIAFADQVIVTERFHLKPLLTWFQDSALYYLLAVDQEGVTLYSGSSQTLVPMNVPGLPKGMEDALKYNERMASLHSGRGTSASGTGGFGQGQSTVHGYGDDDLQIKKREILAYFHVIDGALSQGLEDKTRPLVLCGVDYLLPIFRKASHYSPIMEQGIAGSPSSYELRTLHQRSWEIVEPWFQRSTADALSTYFAHNHDNFTSENLRTLVAASHEGRIDTVFLAEDRNVWGRVEETADEAAVKLNVAPDDGADREDLLDHIGIHTLMNSGRVILLKQEDMPHHRAAAAIFRYPLEGASRGNERAAR